MKKVSNVVISLVLLASILISCAPAATLRQRPTPGLQPPSPAATSASHRCAGCTKEQLIFNSSQLNQVQEIEKVNNLILKPFTAAKVEYVSETDAQQIDRLNAEKKAGKYTFGVLGALHGTYPNMLAIDALQDLTPLATKLASRGIIKEFMTLGKLGTDKQYYIPWMQATYVMAINKKALQYLPAGMDVNKLTYTDLATWGKAIFDATKEKKLGLPAGPNGLMHRLTQGYLYPAYTGGLVTTYRSA